MSFFSSLACWIQWLAKSAASYIVDGVEFIFAALALAINAVLWLLPTVALEPVNLDGGVLGLLNYVVPVGAIVAEFSAIMTAWIIYRIYQWILAWGKVDY